MVYLLPKEKIGIAMFDIKSLKKKVELVSLDEADLIKPKDYISTGNLAVNKIISGSMFRGIPNNRITTFYGESGCVLPGTGIYVIMQIDSDVNSYLHEIEDSRIFDDFLSRIPISDRMFLLQDIGYSMSAIGRKTKLSRQTLYTLLKSSQCRPRKNRKEHSSYFKINALIRKHIYKTEISNIPKFYEVNKDFLILTPVGFRRCSNLNDRGEKDCLQFTISDCDTTTVSKDHIIQLADGKFEFAENVWNEFKNGNENIEIRTIYGNKRVLNVKDAGVLRVYDIEVDDECHTYYADNIVAHNSGKSLIVSEIIINSLKEKNYDAVFYLDSEGGILYDKLIKSGIDQSKFLHVPVSTVEECTETLHKIYHDIKEQRELAKGDESKMPRVLVVIDSLSGLVTTKTITDAEGGKVVQDMGLSAKLRNTMVKSMMVTVMKTCCPLVVIAHAYENMNAMGPQKFQEMAGGKGIRYASHIVVQSSKSRKRQEDASLGLKGGGSYYSANAIRYITYKNRLVKEGLETTMYVDLNKGISKYAGLWDDAIRLGYIQQQGAWYTVPSCSEPTKKFRKDEIAENDDIWNTFLEDMDKQFIKETAYGVGEMPSDEEA